MKRGIGATLAIVGGALIVATALVSADRLVLRDGRRIDGQLVSVQRGVIEFREDRGWRGSRVIQVPRDEVERIDLEEIQQDRRNEPPPGQVEREDRQEGDTRPGGMREREVWVAANRAWTDTGVDVRNGQPVYFTTHNGDIQWKRGGHTRAGGDPGVGYDGNRPMPDRPMGALIGKIGDRSGDYFFVGDDEGRFRMRGAGRLFLGINDSNVTDNQGAYRVTIYY